MPKKKLLPKHCHWNCSGGIWRVRFRKGKFNTYLEGTPWSDKFMDRYNGALKGIKQKRQCIIDNFWAYVDKSAGDKSCWPWTRQTDRAGYGRAMPHNRKGDVLAHRHAWIFAKGKIPGDLHVLHHCDNPACCNPAHLFLGTPQDNAEDRDKKGRWKDHWAL